MINLIAYLHNQTYYTDPNPSSVCFQRQHQGELCPSSHACSNSTYNTSNIVLETEGTTGTGLIAGRDILPNEIIAVSGNAIILQERGLIQEFTKRINAYNMDHPTRGFQYSIFYPENGIHTHQWLSLISTWNWLTGCPIYRNQSSETLQGPAGGRSGA